jgi:hypothetical protein
LNLNLGWAAGYRVGENFNGMAKIQVALVLPLTGLIWRIIGLKKVAGLSILSTRHGAVSKSPTAFHTTEIDLAAAKFFLTTRTVAATTAWCLKHMAILVFLKLCLFYTVRITSLGVGKKRQKKATK